jgi:LPXTG-motif cell wall-anchored protein
LTINKKDESNKPLQDAGFELYKKNTEGQYVLIGTEQSGDDNATFQWKGLDDGDYKLVESTVPAGYNKMADIEFSITAEHNEKADDPKLITLEGGNLVDGDFALDGIIVQDIKNYTGTVLPETGAKGTIGLILGGSALAILAVVFMITRKKMSVYEA